MDATGNPFRELVSGRLATYFDEAFGELSRGRLRGTYDYGMLALNTTLFELIPGRSTLFEKLEQLVARKSLDPEVLEQARGREFLRKHDRGITDMDLSYMTTEDLRDFLGFLKLFYGSLRARGVAHEFAAGVN